jgi:hypothetical protein
VNGDITKATTGSGWFCSLCDRQLIVLGRPHNDTQHLDCRCGSMNRPWRKRVEKDFTIEQAPLAAYDPLTVAHLYRKGLRPKAGIFNPFLAEGDQPITWEEAACSSIEHLRDELRQILSYVAQDDFLNAANRLASLIEEVPLGPRVMADRARKKTARAGTL